MTRQVGCEAQWLLKVYANGQGTLTSWKEPYYEVMGLKLSVIGIGHETHGNLCP